MQRHTFTTQTRCIFAAVLMLQHSPPGGPPNMQEFCAAGRRLIPQNSHASGLSNGSLQAGPVSSQCGHWRSTACHVNTKAANRGFHHFPAGCDCGSEPALCARSSSTVVGRNLFLWHMSFSIAVQNATSRRIYSMHCRQQQRAAPPLDTDSGRADGLAPDLSAKRHQGKACELPKCQRSRQTCTN